jgi:hypothetical protein
MKNTNIKFDPNELLHPSTNLMEAANKLSYAGFNLVN